MPAMRQFLSGLVVGGAIGAGVMWWSQDAPPAPPAATARSGSSSDAPETRAAPARTREAPPRPSDADDAAPPRAAPPAAAVGGSDAPGLAAPPPSGADEAPGAVPPRGRDEATPTVRPEDVQDAIAAAKPAVLTCYEEALKSRADLAGVLKVRFTVESASGAGRLRDAEIVDDGLGGPFLGMCVLKALADVDYPAPPGGEPLTVTYPFRLSPGP
jgi:hypothetical protein